MPTTWDARPSTPSAPLLVCLALTFASISCNDSTGPDAGAAGLALSRDDIALVPGGHFQLEVRPENPEAEALIDQGLEWSSSDPDVATVDRDGLVEAVAEGTTRITASVVDHRDASVSADVRVALLSFRSIATGQDHACGLTPDGEAWCWGRGSMLGDGSGDPTDLPVRVAGGHRFQQIDASAAHTCALATDGRGYCWGSDLLGIEPDSCSGGRCESVVESFVPVAVEIDQQFESISAGWVRTCGLTSDGVVYCWETKHAPAEERLPHRLDTDVRFTQISVGGHHACGLTTEGEIYCWGSNTYGELGVETEVSGFTPTPIRAAVLGDDRFRAVLATQHEVTCGIRTDDVLLCFGHNDTAQLGRGFRSSSEPIPETPAGLGPVASISGGVFHLCAVTADGIGYCWGGLAVGQLGQGEFDTSDVPVQVADVSNFGRIDVGFQIATCGVSTDEVAYCWGRNLGIDDEDRVNVPTPVPGQRP